MYLTMQCLTLVKVICDGGNTDDASFKGDVVEVGVVMGPVLAELIKGRRGYVGGPIV